jgi:hypothetical protein
MAAVKALLILPRSHSDFIDTVVPLSPQPVRAVSRGEGTCGATKMSHTILVMEAMRSSGIGIDVGLWDRTSAKATRSSFRVSSRAAFSLA